MHVGSLSWLPIFPAFQTAARSYTVCFTPFLSFTPSRLQLIIQLLNLSYMPLSPHSVLHWFTHDTLLCFSLHPLFVFTSCLPIPISPLLLIVLFFLECFFARFTVIAFVLVVPFQFLLPMIILSFLLEAHPFYFFCFFKPRKSDHHQAFGCRANFPHVC